MDTEILRFEIIFAEFRDFYENFTVLCWFIIVLNIVTFVAFAVDKAKAKMGAWRISENMLLGLSLIGGAAGGLLAMHIFHHKVRKPRFSIGVPLMLCVHLAIFAALLYIY